MIVFDSSTLILLAKAELLDDFLDDYTGTVLIPREVETECCRTQGRFDALLIRTRIRENKIGVAKISNTTLRTRLMRDFRISKGEAEALVLAQEKEATLVATDDKNAITACKLLRIPFTSAIALLVRMTDTGAVGADRAHAAFKALARYGRYSERILQDAHARLPKR